MARKIGPINRVQYPSGGWAQQWKVPSRSSKDEHVVSYNRNGDCQWACGCRGWTQHFPRSDCFHIGEVKQTLPERNAPPPPRADRVQKRAARTLNNDRVQQDMLKKLKDRLAETQEGMGFQRARRKIDL